MSIEIKGPEGYAFQDSVLVWYFLIHASERGFELVVEPQAGEDATAKLGKAELRWTVEIQCKSGAGDLDFGVLSEWLWHFPPLQATDSLLDRLIAEERTSVLFITGRRCMDALRRLATDGVEMGLGRGGIAQSDVAAFVDALADGSHWSDETELRRQRRQRRVGTSLRPSDATRVAKRIRVVEEWDQTRVEREIRELLLKKRVPARQTESTARKMAEYVRQSVPGRADVVPGLREILDRSVAGAILGKADREYHVGRAEETELRKVLRSRRVILLTGSGQCGKTHVAKLLAQGQQDLGFEVQRGGIEDATAFLLTGGAHEGLFLLEDVFEDALVDGNVARCFDRVGQLIRELPKHRMLIVTARTESLRGMRRADGTPLGIDGHEWVDLTLKDPALACEIWKSHGHRAGVAKERLEAFGNHIRAQTSEFVIQPGQIRYLALNFPTDEEMAAEELERLARFNAKNLAGELGTEEMRKVRTVLQAMAVGTTPSRGVSTTELSFILSESSARPGMLTEDGVVFHGAAEPEFPSYSAVPEMLHEYTDALDFLQTRGWIDRDGDSIRFAHPDYREAAVLLLEALPAGELDAVLAILERALACLCPHVAYSAARCLRHIGARYKSVAAQTRLRKLAVSALGSIFPATRDEAARFLATDGADLDEDERKAVLAWVTRGDYGDSVSWHEGQPWLSPTRPLGLWLFRHGPECVRLDDIDTPQKAWIALNEPVSLEMIVHCLGFSEAFIRAAAADRYMSLASVASMDVLRRLLRDQPAVVAGALRGATREWPTYSSENREMVLDALRDAFKQELNVLGCADFMNRFYQNIDEDHDGDEWQLWAELAPIFLRASGARWSLGIDTIWHLVHEARQFVPPEALTAVCLAWLDAVEAWLRSTLPSGDSLAVADFLLDLVPHDHPLRSSVVSRLLANRDTGFVAVSLVAFLERWNVLAPDEKEAICGLLLGDRVDRRWLQAVALTTTDPPADLVRRLVGKDDAFSPGPAGVSELLDPELLRRCLHVHAGAPQPLWWLGLQFRARKTWDGIVGYLRSQPASPAFTLAWITSLRHEPHESLAGWRSLCAEGDARVLERLFELLLRATKEVNDDFSGHWSSLWEAAQAGQRNCWARQIGSEIDEVCRYRAPWDVFLLPNMINNIFELLPNDTHALKLVAASTQGGATNGQGIEGVREIYADEQRKPRLFWVHQVVEDMIHGLPDTQDLEQIVDSARVASLRNWKESELVEDSIEGADWVYAHKGG